MSFEDEINQAIDDTINDFDIDIELPGVPSKVSRFRETLARIYPPAAMALFMAALDRCVKESTDD